TVQAYAPLDQYLMGFREPKDVPATFLVTGASPALTSLHPMRGFSFDGQRRDISIGEIVQTMGRRTPDSTVAQRRFRFGFTLVVAKGTHPSAPAPAKLAPSRGQFEPFFAEAATANASAQTTLRRSLKLSLSPASGVVVGTTTAATLTVQTAPPAALTVQFQT